MDRVQRTRERLRWALRRPIIERRVLRRAAQRGVGIALVWHRIGPVGPQPHEAVRTLATTAFAAQLDLLRELGDIVPLARLRIPPDRPERPRFALTFDDDDSGHAAHALPELRARGLPATFFLSGRWCHDYGPYWWHLVEEEIRQEGIQEVAARRGLPASLDPAGLVAALTGTDAAAALVDRARRVGEPPMTHDEAATLIKAGMEIGFHTLDHALLTNLDDRDQATALVRGRQELSRDLGVPLDHFAYPHGRSDARVERAVAAAGYASAWTTRRQAVHPAAPPLNLGRWDIGQRPLDDARATLLWGLARPHR